MSSFLSLSQLMAIGRGSDYPVFLHEGQVIVWPAFCADVKQVIEDIEKRWGERWLLSCEDSYYFTVGLLALIVAQKSIILPANAQPGTLESMQDYFDYCLTDYAIEQEHVRIRRAQSATPTVFVSVDPQPISLTLFTSGTTGKPTPVVKSLACFEAEIAALHQGWSERLQGNLIASSVPHYHAYGIIFHVLWPLCAGTLIMAKRVMYSEELLSYLQHSDICFISSPACLRRWYELLDDAKPSARLRYVFSAGGALPEPVVQAFAEHLAHPVIEVYGSTETGVVASRAYPETAWQALPVVGLSVESDNRLKVSSSYTIAGSHVMGDTVTMLSDGRFRLEGRADNIIKIEEKRLSTHDMAGRCQELGWFEEVRFIVLKTSRKEMIGVVAILTEAGKNMLAEQGKIGFVNSVKKHLIRYFEPVLLPRKWRFVDDFPKNEIGKVLHAELVKLF